MDKAFASKLDEIVASAKRAQPLHSCLYVEDSYANTLLVEQLISRRGDMKLLTANTGPIGIKMAQDFHPDIIFMDINLPGMSGIEAMGILQADPMTANIPITALSSNAYPNQIEEGLQKGFFRYITKPFKLDEFNAAIDDMLLHVTSPG